MAQVFGKTGHPAVVFAGQLGQRYSSPVADDLGNEAWTDFMADQPDFRLGIDQRALGLVGLRHQARVLLFVALVGLLFAQG
ncbi:hypothetical protein D9M71_623760 [compost metagenome]